MALRTLLCVAAAALVSSAFAQVLGPVGDPDVEAALTTLRQQNEIFLQLTGTVMQGSTTTPISCDEFWSQSSSSAGTPFVQSELLEYRGGNLVGRVVADGTSVWKYNLVAHEYRTSLYGRYGDGPVPDTYLTDALTDLRSSSNEYGAFCTRLLTQIFGGGHSEAAYQTWLPGATVVEVANTLIPNEFDVIYSLGSPVRRKLTFRLTIIDYTTQLIGIDYLDIAKMGSQQKVVAWTMTPYIVVTNTANYLPYTYSQIPGWRIVTGGN
jgi:hypothetical protein